MHDRRAIGLPASSGKADRLWQLMDGERQYRGCSSIGEQSCRYGRCPPPTNRVVDQQHRARESRPGRESRAVEQVLGPYGRGGVDRRRWPADCERAHRAGETVDERTSGWISVTTRRSWWPSFTSAT
jgi:hypothetical protein